MLMAMQTTVSAVSKIYSLTPPSYKEMRLISQDIFNKADTDKSGSFNKQNFI